MAHNDEAAVGVLKALRAADIDVPGQVSVVGFEGTELAAHADPPLTTLEVRLEKIGARRETVTAPNARRSHSSAFYRRWTIKNQRINRAAQEWMKSKILNSGTKEMEMTYARIVNAKDLR
jgi:hypothetical protein